MRRFTLALVACLPAGGVAVAGEVIMKSGDRCGADGGGVCLTFEAALGFEPRTISTITFTAPSAGTVAATVSGTMQCGNNNGSESNALGVIDLGGQIVKGEDAPLWNGVGGSRYAMRLRPVGLPTTAVVQYTNAVNLAVSRQLPVKSGKNTITYRMVMYRADPGAFCTIYNTQLQMTFASK